MMFLHCGQDSLLPPNSAGRCSSASQKGQVKSMVCVDLGFSSTLGADDSASRLAAKSSTSAGFDTGGFATELGITRGFLQAGHAAFLPAICSLTARAFLQFGH